MIYLNYAKNVNIASHTIINCNMICECHVYLYFVVAVQRRRRRWCRGYGKKWFNYEWKWKMTNAYLFTITKFHIPFDYWINVHHCSWLVLIPWALTTHQKFMWILIIHLVNCYSKFFLLIHPCFILSVDWI